MPTELTGLSDWVLSCWFPIGKSSHAGAVKEAWEGRGGAGLN